MTILFLMATMFIANIGFGVILPTLPFLSQNVGASTFEMGLALSVFAIAQFLSSSAWGIISDRVGRRPVLIFGIVGYGLSSALLGFAPNVVILLLLRFLAGLFASAVLPSSQALAADWSAPEDRARVMGYMGSMNGIGFIFGPPIGAFLSFFGLQIPFFCVGLLSILNGLLALRFLPKESKIRNTEAPLAMVDASKRPTRWMQSLGNWLIAPFLFGTFAFSLADASITATLAYYLTGHLHSTQTMAGWAFMVNGAMGALTQGLFFSKLYNKYGEVITIICGYTFGMIGYLTLGLSHWLFWAFVALMLLAFCRGLSYPAITTAISLRTAKASQGSSFGAQSTYNSLGRSVGPLIAGWLFALKEQAPYFFSSMLMLIMILFYLVWAQRSRKTDLHENQDHSVLFKKG